MGILSKLFGKKDAESKTGGIEDYMTLVRVYFQAVLAERMGITNLGMLPDLRTFKTTLHIPTQNNKLGVGEKAACKKMMREIYHTDDTFFKEIDQSVRRNCKKVQDVQPYFIQFQQFTNDLMMLVSNLLKFKLRVPSFFKSAIRSFTDSAVDRIFSKNDFSDAAEVKTVLGIRKYNQRLGFSQQWTSDFVYQVVMLAKKEPRAKEDEKK